MNEIVQSPSNMTVTELAKRQGNIVQLNPLDVRPLKAIGLVFARRAQPPHSGGDFYELSGPGVSGLIIVHLTTGADLLVPNSPGEYSADSFTPAGKDLLRVRLRDRIGAAGAKSVADQMPLSSYTDADDRRMMRKAMGLDRRALLDESSPASMALAAVDVDPDDIDTLDDDEFANLIELLARVVGICLPPGTTRKNIKERLEIAAPTALAARGDVAKRDDVHSGMTMGLSTSPSRHETVAAEQIKNCPWLGR